MGEKEGDYLSRAELLLARLPAVRCDLPGGLGDERWEREPVVILVFLEVRKGDEKELTEFRGVSALDDVRPHLGVWA